MLDLDTSFGLSAFGSEGQTASRQRPHLPLRPRGGRCQRRPDASRHSGFSAARPVDGHGRAGRTRALGGCARAGDAHTVPAHTPAHTSAARRPRGGPEYGRHVRSRDLRQLTPRAAAYASLRPAAAAPQPPWRRPWVLPATAGLVVLALLMAGTCGCCVARYRDRRLGRADHQLDA